MIFLVDARDPGTVGDWLLTDGRSVADRVEVMTWQSLLRSPELPARTCIFGDVELLGSALRQLACTAWDQLRAAGVYCMNGPRRVLGRTQLLGELAGRGRNRFRAFSLHEVPEDVRFPVFLRRNSAHDGAKSPLLHSHAEIDDVVRRLTWPRGPHLRSDLLVVEFCNTTTDDGRFEKMAVFRVGDTIIPRHRLRADDWSVKVVDAFVDRETVEIGRRFLEENPHRDWAMETFEIAGIDYGRLDYALCRGELEAFEINTNPSIGSRAPSRGSGSRRHGRAQRELLEPLNDSFHAAYREALVRHDRSPRRGPDRVTLVVPPELRNRYRLERLRHTIGSAVRLGSIAAYRRLAFERRAQELGSGT